MTTNDQGKLSDAASRERQVDALFSQWDKAGSPGFAIGIIRNGKMVYGRGYGMATLDYDIPLTTQSMFNIGSEAKQFTAMCIVILSRRGLLSLDDPIQKYLPETMEYEDAITIRHLIHHTSGLREYCPLGRFVGFNFENHIPHKAIFDLICAQKGLNHRPGTEFSYCNTGYILLAEIVRRVSGMNLRDFAEKEIFSPLGMKNTLFRNDYGALIRNRAFGHTRTDAGFRALTSDFDMIGDGGLWTTVEDLCLWDANFYDNILDGGDQTLIDEVTTRETLGSDEVQSYAFGLEHGTYRGLPIIFHGGRFAGHRAYLMRFPSERFSVICLSNIGGEPLRPFACQIADIYLTESFESSVDNSSMVFDSPPEEAATPGEILTPEDITRYCGSYFSEELDVTYKLVVDSGRLSFALRGLEPIHLEPTGSSAFEGLWGFGRFEFEMSAIGEASEFFLCSQGVRRIKFVRQKAE